MREGKQIFVYCRFIGVVHKTFVFFMIRVFIIALISSTLIKCELFACKYNGMYFVIL